MKAVLNFLTDSEIEDIHKASLRILEKTGVKIHSEAVRKLLASNGAKVKSKVIRIPPSLVEKAIKKAPRNIPLSAREPKFDLTIPSGTFPFISPVGFPSLVEDFDTGKNRKSLSSDLKDFALISDYLDTVDYFWPVVMPGDKLPALQEFYSLLISLQTTGKHIQCSCVSEKTAKWAIELASIIVGGKQKLKQRPIFSTINCTISPLTFEKGSSEAMVVLARAGIPVAPMSMVLAGSSGPTTLAGTLALANAEELASLVILECASSGAPMIYTTEISSADMKNAAINYQAPEYPLLCAGCAQMARFYKLPNLTANVPVETPPSDLLSLERNVLKTAMLLLTRTDLSTWLGGRDAAKSASLVQVILDAEAYEHAKAYLRRFELNEDTLALGVIDKVGQMGHFLKEKHTMEHFHRELWLKELASTFILDLGKADSFLESAKAKAKEILSTHRAPVISEDKHSEMEQIVQAAEKDIMG